MPVKTIAIYTGEINTSVFIENLIRGLADRGFLVYLFGTDRDKINYENKNIVKIVTPSSKLGQVLHVVYHFLHGILFHPLRVYKLVRYLHHHKEFRSIYFIRKFLPVLNYLPQIFHLQWAKSAAEWIFLKELYGVRLVLSLRGAHINYSPLSDPTLAESYRKVFPHYDRFHAVSNAIADSAALYNARRDLIQVIYSGVDIDHITIKEKSNYTIKSSVKVVLVGRFHWKKGYDFALLALSRLLKRGYQVEYTVIARGYDEKFQYLMKCLDLDKHVKVLAGLPHNEVLELMREQDMLLIPSFEEGIANVAIEAMFVGLPVISSNCGGMSELIENRESGLLFENWNLEALEFAMIEMINMSGTSKKSMSQAGKQVVLSRHTRNLMVDQFQGLYSSL